MQEGIKVKNHSNYFLRCKENANEHCLWAYESYMKQDKEAIC